MDEEDKIEKLLRELREMKEEHAELQGHVESTFSVNFEEIASMDKMILEAEKAKDFVWAEMREADPQAFLDLAEGERDIKKKEEEIKRACYDLPLSRLKKGSYVKAHGLKVSLSKATIKRSYDPRIIRDMPDLEKLEVDGDFVVTKSVNASVLDRLVAEGKFEKQIADKYVLEEKVRNPQVRIRADGGEDEE